MKQIVLFIAILSLIACNNCQINQVENKSVATQKTVSVKKIDGSFLVLNDNSRFNSRLYEMKYLESLTDVNGSTYFVLSGRTCKECDENISIFLISPKDTLKPVPELSKYLYPGKVFDYENNKLVFESKLYIGNSFINDKTSKSLIWLQKVKSKKLENLMLIVEVFNGKIRERNFKPQSQEYKRCFKNLKNCREIKGVDVSSEP